VDTFAASCKFIRLFARCLYIERILKRTQGMSKESSSVSAIKLQDCNKEIMCNQGKNKELSSEYIDE